MLLVVMCRLRIVAMTALLLVLPASRLCAQVAAAPNHAPHEALPPTARANAASYLPGVTPSAASAPLASPVASRSMHPAIAPPVVAVPQWPPLPGEAPEAVALRQPAAAPVIGDPAVETVDQETVGYSRPHGFSLREHWDNIKDPAITTVDQQTHGYGEDEDEWYELLSIRGYAQVRLNELLWQADGSAPREHIGDSSVADDQTFFIRRARLVFSGDISDNLFVYVQPDFAASVPNSSDAILFVQLRDCYGDVYLDDDKVHRIRIGQSKIPYGWENLQSSSNRVTMDRNDGLNTFSRNERDLGVLYYYTPEYAQDLFKFVLDEGLKGSGNYGMFGVGVYNGQGGSTREENDGQHVVARLAVPFQLPSGQIAEVGIQGYTGQFVVQTAPISPLGVGPPVEPVANSDGYLDRRIAWTWVWYPQPLGFLTEWNVGQGPALNEAQTEVIDRSLYGGYAMLYYRYESENCGVLFPFVKWNRYKGGYKNEDNAPYGYANEWDVGVEWEFTPQMELTTQLTFTDRTNTEAYLDGESYRQFDGALLRFQFQFNY